ncbi:MAG: hypothetical protein JW878_08285 [Methanomicrobia archaeon]|nr:hypothetical protein [Methanomicrobia archaeon]
MDFEEMVSVLKKVNKERDEQVDEKFLEQILALVIKNPLDSDRGRCQDQIMELIKQRGGD